MEESGKREHGRKRVRTKEGGWKAEEERQGGRENKREEGREMEEENWKRREREK